MNNDLLKNEIRTIIESIRHMSDQIDEHKGKIPQIEIDLMASEIRKLYGGLLKLDRINNEFRPSDSYRQDEQSFGQVESAVSKETGKQKRKSPEDADLFSEQSGTVADKYKKEARTVSDKISTDQKEESLGDKYQKNIIPDLKTAIGINDKFAFINELFEGDMQEYKVAIDKLNEFDNREQALDYFELISKERKWDDKSNHVKLLKDYILRRYPEEE